MSRLTRLSRLKKLMKPRLAQRAAGCMENQKRKQEADIDEDRLLRRERWVTINVSKIIIIAIINI